MILFRLKELMAAHEKKIRRPLTVNEVAQETGISRRTLSSIANVRGYVTSTDVIDRLCVYFECELTDFLIHAKEDQSAKQMTDSPKSKKKKANQN